MIISHQGLVTVFVNWNNAVSTPLQWNPAG